MIIDDSFATVGQSMKSFWHDELENLKIMLIGYDKAILALTTGGVQEYTLDTGQNRQIVKRADLASLQTARDKIIGQIAVLESRLKIGGSRSPQIIPGW